MVDNGGSACIVVVAVNKNNIAAAGVDEDIAVAAAVDNDSIVVVAEQFLLGPFEVVGEEGRSWETCGRPKKKKKGGVDFDPFLLCYQSESFKLSCYLAGSSSIIDLKMLSTRPLNVPSSVLRKPSKSTTTTTAALDNNKENNDFSSPKIQFLGKTPSFAGGRKSLKTGGATTSTAAKTITTIKASTKKTSTSSSSPSSASVKKVQQQPLVPLPTNKRLLTLRDITNTSTPKSSTNRNTTTTNPSKKLSQTLKKSVAPKTLLAASVEDLQDIEYMPPRSIPLSTCGKI